MKPPPRTRKTPTRIGELAEAPRRAGRVACQWQRAEQHKLLRALKALHKTAEPHRDIDYSLLEAKLPSRPLAEIRAMVEQLKKQVISTTADRLQKGMRAEQSVTKPIEKWTELAAALTGSHEEAISAAFSQMLIVSSTEPCSLRNSYPPVDPAGRPTTVGPQPSTPEHHPGTRRTCPLEIKTPPPALGAVVRVPSAPPAAAPAGLGPPQQLQNPLPTEPHRPHPSAAPRPLNTPPASSSTPPTAAHQSSTENTSRMVGGKDMVDFERIYCFLSRIQEPSESHLLTPMESAIVLDLLMSLPEELRLLDCNKLHKHLTQVYQCFFTPRDSKTANPTFHELREGLSLQAKGRAAPDPGSGQTSAPPQSAHKNLPSCDAGGQSEDGWDVPPLNPFMMPLRLLKRREEDLKGRLFL